MALTSNSPRTKIAYQTKTSCARPAFSKDIKTARNRILVQCSLSYVSRDNNITLCRLSWSDVTLERPSPVAVVGYSSVKRPQNEDKYKSRGTLFDLLASIGHLPRSLIKRRISLKDFNRFRKFTRLAVGASPRDRRNICSYTQSIRVAYTTKNTEHIFSVPKTSTPINDWTRVFFSTNYFVYRYNIR